MDKVDFLIVGQGIAGSLLAHELMKAGKRITVINKETELTSSNKAAGLYNPITGRKMVKTWQADTIFPGLEAYYQELEETYDASFIYPKTIYRPFFSVAEQNDWQVRASSAEYSKYIKNVRSAPIGIDYLDDQYGGLELNFSGYVDLPALVKSIRIFLLKKGLYHNETFEYERMTINRTSVAYKGFQADKVIFCDGPGSSMNPYFSFLPFKPVKGEIIAIEADLPEDIIINRGVFIVPKHGLFSVGSTYDHERLDFVPTEKGEESLLERLAKVYKGKCKVVQKSAGVRPATYDRRPFLGFHPEHPALGIFNGFGTKGVSLVPYCTRLLVTHLSDHRNLPKEVDIKRVNLS